MINHIKSSRQIEKYQGWNFLFIDYKKIILDGKKGSFSGMKLPVCRLEGSNWWERFQMWWYMSLNDTFQNLWCPYPWLFLEEVELKSLIKSYYKEYFKTLICSFLQETAGEPRAGPVWNSNGPGQHSNYNGLGRTLERAGPDNSGPSTALNGNAVGKQLCQPRYSSNLLSNESSCYKCQVHFPNQFNNPW